MLQLEAKIMTSFKDAKGKTYDINLTIGLAKLIKSRTKVDILNLDDVSLQKIFGDDLVIAEIISICITNQLPDVEDIVDSFDGDSLQSATKAFIDELCFFFLRRGRQDKAKMLEMYQTALNQAISETEQEISKITGQQFINAQE